MNRREVILWAAVEPFLAAALPVLGWAQQGGVRRVGVLMSYREVVPAGEVRLSAFRDGLREPGWVE